MSDAFDPYFKWLSIPPEEQPPNHYRLLGVPLYVADLDVISNAADRQMSHLRTYQTGPNAAASQKILNEISAARLCLLNPERKAAYDQQLQAKLTPPTQPNAASAAVAQPAAPAANPYGDLEFEASAARSEPRGRKKAASQDSKPQWLMPALLGCGALVILGIAGFAMSRGKGTPANVAKLEAISPPATAEKTPSPPAPTAPVAKLPNNTPPSPPPAKPAVVVDQPVPEKVTPPVEVATTPPPKMPAEPALPQLNPGDIDLIKSIDLTKDVVKGDWRVDGDALFSGNIGHSKIYLGPPGIRDYALTAIVERTASNVPLNRAGGLNFDLLVGGRQVRLFGDAPRYYCVWALESIDGLPSSKSKVETVMRAMVPDRPVAKIRCEVRGGHIVVSANDQTLLDWNGDPKRLSMPPGTESPDKSRLVLSTDAGFRFSRLVLTPLDAATPSAPQPAAEKPMPAQPVVPETFAKAPFSAQLARTYQEAWAKRLGMPVENRNSIGMNLKVIPPGEYMMGSTKEEVAKVPDFPGKNTPYFDSEAPQHRVVLTHPFLMAATEVTVGEFEQFLEESDYVSAKEKTEIADRNSKVKVGVDMPVSYVPWDQACAFCVWLSEHEDLDKPYEIVDQKVKVLPGNGYRLPTEAQWEFACRAGTTTTYSFGNDEQQLQHYGWYNLAQNSSTRPHVVANLEPNAFGLYDMLGNMYEWCQDPYNSKYYEISPIEDPPGPTQGSPALRGGAWAGTVHHLRSAHRWTYAGSVRSAHIGFRVVRNLKTP